MYRLFNIQYINGKIYVVSKVSKVSKASKASRVLKIAGVWG